MAFDFKLLNKIDKKTKHTVSGWIRELETSMQINHVSIVSDIIILYFRDDEIFDIEFLSTDIHISKDKKQAIKMNRFDNYNWYNNTYGALKISSIDPMIYKWDLKIIRTDHNKDTSEYQSGLLIGISSSLSPHNRFEDSQGYNYCYLHNGKIYEPPSYWNQYAAQTWKSNDIVTMELDLMRANLRFWINNQDQGIAYSNIKNDDENIKYRLFISLFSPKDGFQIVDFSKRDAD